MRKIAILLMVSATMITLNSCQKKGVETPTTIPQKAPSFQTISFLIPDSDSGVHNNLTRYILQNHREPAESLAESAGWIVDAYNTIYGTGFNVDSAAGVLVGYATSSGMLASGACTAHGDMVVCNSLVNSLPSSVLKSALTNINANTDIGIVYLNYAKGVMAPLSYLTGGDALMRDGYIGIGEGSLSIVYGAAYTPLQKTRIAKADADGFVYGYIGSGGSVLFARLNSAWDSSIQREIEGGNCPICHNPH